MCGRVMKMILGCSCCRKIKVGLGGCGRFCGEVLVGCRLEGRGLLGKSEFVHLGIWASGHLGIWLSGYLGIWASGHLGFWASGLLGIWASRLLGIWASGLLGIWASERTSIQDHPVVITSQSKYPEKS